MCVGEVVALFNPGRRACLRDSGVVRVGGGIAHLLLTLHLILLRVHAIVPVVEHVLHVLRVVLGGVVMVMELLVLVLLLVRQFNRTGSVKELGGSIGAHVLKLNPIDSSPARSTAASTR